MRTPDGFQRDRYLDEIVVEMTWNGFISNTETASNGDRSELKDFAFMKCSIAQRVEMWPSGLDSKTRRDAI